MAETVLNGLSVLLVDDEPTIVETLFAFLHGQGCKMTITTDSVQAREILKSSSFDLALLDISMPRVNGADLARQARARLPGIRIIFITGIIDPDEVEEKTAGIENFRLVEKPFSLSDLQRIIAEECAGIERR